MSGLGIGESLNEARTARGLSLDDAERDTRISRHYLQALEDEAFHIIPAPVYARGFLRSYAQYLGIEAAPLLARYPQQAPTPNPVPAPPASSPPGPARGPSAIFRSRLPSEPMIGVDIGAVPSARRFRPPQLPFVRTALVLIVAIAVTAIVVVGALAIVNLGNGNESAAPTPIVEATATPEPEATPTESGLDVQWGIVPNLVGETEAVAILALEEAGFTARVVRESNEQYPLGTIFDQAPIAGAALDPGREVTIAVSEGP